MHKSFTPSMSREEIEELDRKRGYNNTQYLQHDMIDSSPKSKRPWDVKTPVNKGNNMSAITKGCDIHKNTDCPDDCNSSCSGDILMKETKKSAVSQLKVASNLLKKSKEDLEEAKRDLESAKHELDEVSNDVEKALTSRSLQLPRAIIEDHHRAANTVFTNKYSRLTPGVSVTPLVFQTIEDVFAKDNARAEETKKNIENVRKSIQRNAERHRVINPYSTKVK